MKNSDNIKQVLKILLLLKEEGPLNPELGICSNFSSALEIHHLDDWDVYWFFKDIISGNDFYNDYEFYSGQRDFPISPGGSKSPHQVYINSTGDEMWSKDYEYGRRRLALLDYMIEKFEEIENE